MIPQDFTQAPAFGINGILGLQQNAYYWLRHPEDTRFIAKLEGDCWYTFGVQWAIAVTRDQVICPVKIPEN